MSSMKEMAKEYRIAAAKLAMRIDERKELGASEDELKRDRRILRDIREIQRLLDGYYEYPRNDTYSSVCWKND